MSIYVLVQVPHIIKLELISTTELNEKHNLYDDNIKLQINYYSIIIN